MIGCDNSECEYEWVSQRRSRRCEGVAGDRAILGFALKRSVGWITLTPVPRQVRQYEWRVARDMVLPRLRHKAWIRLERRLAARTEEGL